MRELSSLNKTLTPCSGNGESITGPQGKSLPTFFKATLVPGNDHTPRRHFSRRIILRTNCHKNQDPVLPCSAFFTVQLSHPYTTTGKTMALTRRTFVGKVMSLILNMLSRLVITFLPRSERLLISWLQSPSAVILLALF